MRRLVALLPLLFAPTAHADDKPPPPLLAKPGKIAPGRWRVASQMTMEGARGQMRPQGFVRCIKPEETTDADAILRAISRSPDEKAGCKPKQVHLEGDRLVWDMACEGKAWGHGEVLLKPGALIGWVEMQQPAPSGSGALKMRIDIVGSRVGECGAK